MAAMEKMDYGTALKYVSDDSEAVACSELKKALANVIKTDGEHTISGHSVFSNQ